MDLTVIDLDIFLSSPHDSDIVTRECKRAAEALTGAGALVLHDSRVSESDNSAFLDLMEDYFSQPMSELEKDVRPELQYTVGVTLENTERPKCAVHEPCLRIIQQLAPEERPIDVSGHSPDPKSRFFWAMTETPPYKTQFPTLNAENVIPQAENLKKRWTPAMQAWGMYMKNAVEGLAKMLAIGFELPEDYFTNAGKYGPHRLAPTASDLVKYGQKDQILAGFHTDLNFLTIHGRSRYPGLNIWARNTGKRIAVKIPEAGYHEVVVTEATLEVMEKRRREFPDRPLRRISSTFFWHLSSDYDLSPIPSLVKKKAAYGEDLDTSEYPKMKAGQQVQNELKNIALMV
ncbi:Clavaminate synthase [Pyrrhoderma noxium]|uniref:Clavaminate synthase n=1 Tax=Pyrrhoderma noxium TaxID=2282107 RepID=A0A286UIP5_9AGAM|nr:Clavaminate synthase [Pyrrhoderma noxium]